MMCSDTICLQLLVPKIQASWSIMILEPGSLKISVTGVQHSHLRRLNSQAVIGCRIVLTKPSSLTGPMALRHAPSQHQIRPARSEDQLLCLSPTSSQAYLASHHAPRVWQCVWVRMQSAQGRVCGQLPAVAPPQADWAVN